MPFRHAAKCYCWSRGWLVLPSTASWHAAAGTLVPGKSTGAPGETTAHQDRALLTMVQQDRFVSARTLTARVRNLYGIRAGRKTINDRLLSRGSRAYRDTRKRLLTANHRHLRLEWAQRWQNLSMAHCQRVIFGDGSRFQSYPVDDMLKVLRLPGERSQQRCLAFRVQDGGCPVHLWGAFRSGATSSLVLPDRYLTGELYGAFCETP